MMATGHESPVQYLNIEWGQRLQSNCQASPGQRRPDAGAGGALPHPRSEGRCAAWVAAAARSARLSIRAVGLESSSSVGGCVEAKFYVTYCAAVLRRRIPV
jgi:hypothetical protein